MRNGPYRSELLAPQDAARVEWGAGFSPDEELYYRLLSSLQKLRGRSYLADGAIEREQLTEDGRFVMPGDESSWHFVLTAGADEVIGCVRYSVHDSARVRFEDLRLAHVLRLVDADWAHKLKAAVDGDLRVARERGSAYAELGGWAISEQYRGTKLALETLLASYAWGGLLQGGCICSCTATVRHGSASMLRRIGGAPLMTEEGAFPGYWDPRYGCEMEVLRFDSRVVEPRYQRVIGELQEQLQSRPAIQSCAGEHQFRRSLLALGEAVSVRRGPVPEPVERGEEVFVNRRA
jgi:hypothetical protein